MKKRIAFFAVVSALGCHDATAPATASTVPGSWSWSGSGLPVETINAVLTVRPDDGVMAGSWNGRLVGCTTAPCDASGIVYYGQVIAPDSVDFGLTYVTGDFSIAIAGRVVGAKMVGTASSFRNHTRSPSVPITLTRAP